MSSQCSATGKSQHLLVEVVLFLLGLMSVAQQAAAFTVYVSNTAGFVSVIDSTTNAIRTTIPAGGTGIRGSSSNGTVLLGKGLTPRRRAHLDF
jgi:YVTN family beta-propeller protein